MLKNKSEMNIKDILKILTDNRVEFAVVGGVAVVLYGYVRVTKDIDIILDFTKPNIEKFIKALKAMGYTPGPPIDPLNLADAKKRAAWIQDKDAKAITFYDPKSHLLQLDVLLNYDLSMVETVEKQIYDFTVTVIEYHDLIKMKKESGRQIDILDIERLEELHK